MSRPSRRLKGQPSHPYSRWRAEFDRTRPGTVSPMEHGADTSFGHDIPALLSWEFGPAEATKISCPVLYRGDADTGRFRTMRSDTLVVFHHAESETVTGAGHLVASTHPSVTAQRVVEFLDRHAGPV